VLLAVRFLAVGKVSAKLVVATYINQDVAGLDLQSLAGKLMKSSKVTRLGAGGDCHLSAGDSTEVHVHVDAEDHAFIAVTPTDYPRRLITAAGDGAVCLMNGALQFVAGA